MGHIVEKTPQNYPREPLRTLHVPRSPIQCRENETVSAKVDSIAAEIHHHATQAVNRGER